MNNYNQHILHRVNFEINSDNEQKAFSIKANIDGFLKKELFPFIENLFDESVSPEEIKRYNSIDLELKMKSSDSFEVLKDQLISQLREKIEKADSECLEPTRQDDLINNKSFASESQRTGFSDKSTNGFDFNQKKTSSVDKLSNMKNIFLFFLETGQLPWYAIPSLITEFIQSGKFSSSIQDKLFLQKLKLLFLTDQNALDRFIQQFDKTLTEELIFHFIDNQNIDKRRLHSKISGHKQPIKDLLYKLIINSLITQSYKISISQYYQMRDEILNQTRSKTSIKKMSNQIQEILSMTSMDTTSNPSLENLCLAKSQLLIREDAKLPDPQPDSYITTGNLRKIASQSVKETKYEHAFDTRDDLSEKQDIRTESTDIKTENQRKIDLKAVYIQNAGLILAHPFLGDFFARTKCSDEKSMLLPEKKSYAIHLLHYLATRQEMDMEYNLTFEKFLCGVPLDSPVNRKVVLSEHDKIECNDLLRSIISNWPVLKDTSPDGLRQMFIQRDGKLDLQKTPYKLIIERKAQDVLLNKLQWNISIVKLPWLKDLLFIEW